MGKGESSAPPALHAVGSQVWVESNSNKSWLKGEVIKIEDACKLVVRLENGTECVCDQDDIPLQNPGKHGVEDMTTLNYLNEPGVLWNLKIRYQQDDIYTYTGSILIAVNPFAPMPHMYGVHMMEQYRGVPVGEISPHVYAIADAAFCQMRRDKKSQSILVSGESGAGKTETSKLIMQYLAWVGGYLDDGMANGDRTVEQKVLESNPLLEAFGNAKTVRNDNSSRFGKFTEIQFNSEGRISGAAIRTYLLERSRVVNVNDPERNYHVFYQLCDGASEEERSRLRLRPAKEFRYLNRSTCYDLKGVTNAEEYENTRRSMSLVGIPEEEQEAVFKVVAAVLHLGNVEFSDAGDDASQVLPAAEDSLAAAAELLGVDKDGLRHALTTRTRHMVDGPIVSPIDVAAACDNRDSLAKTIYSRMFDWLVNRINSSIGQDPNSSTLIGVLDIYGFEQFDVNDFEQFCINLANEKLQQHFNQHVFKMEQAEYEKEAIEWSYIEFVDNQDVLDLIESKMGVLDLLDETCKFPKASHEDFAQKLYNASNISGSSRFSKPKLAQTDFTIDHYAGGVTYKTEQFLSKNRDFVVAEHQQLLGASAESFVVTLFPAETPDAAAPASSYKFSSVGSRFKRQLSDLMVTLHTMEPHYIRCIKPNSFNRPMDFENSNVLMQLRCGGVLEAVRISCAGYPTKTPYEDFVDHFWMLATDSLNLDDRSLSKLVLERVINNEGSQFGTSKLFLRAGKMAILDKRRTEVMNAAATTLQRFARGFLARLAFKRAIADIIKIQSVYRGHVARNVAREMRQQKAATIIQTVFRSYLARKQFRAAVRAVIAIQSNFRAFKAREAARSARESKAALVLQSHWRRHQAQKEFMHIRQGVIAAQCAWRVKLAKRELRRRRAEARDSSKLLHDKEALEVKFREVQNVLETVQKQRNELRQSLKEEKAAREVAEARATTAEKALEEKITALSAKSEAELKEEREKRESLAAQLAALQKKVDDSAQNAASAQSQLSAETGELKSKVTALERQKAEIENTARAQVAELMKRLNNAVAQRNAAREEALMVGEKLKQMQEDIDAGRLSTATPSTPPSAPIGHLVAASTTSPSGASDGNVFDRMRRYMAGSPSRENGGEHTGPHGRAFEGPGSGGEAMSEMDRRQRELYAKQQQLLREQRTADQERLLTAIKSDLGFVGSKPVGAVVVFRCCLQWRVFQADRTPLFDKIIDAMGKQVESNQDNNDRLSYWLSNTVTLLFLMQKHVKPASGGGYAAKLKAQGQQVTRGIFGSTSKAGLGGFFARSGNPGSPGDEASIHGGTAGGYRQVEAKYPALLFKQQLDAIVQKIFPMLRDNVKKEITPQLAACIHAPRQHGARPGGRSRTTSDGTGAGSAADKSARGDATALSPHWANILAVFEALLDTLKANNVPAFLVRKLFEQLFSFVNVQLFNQLLLRRECCSFSNGEYVKTGLSEVELWISGAGKEWVGDSWDQLAHIRQAVTFLVIHQKHKKSLQEITSDLCPVLSIQQLYRISTMYWDDRYGTETVSHDVLAKMKQQMVEGTSTSASHSFLLDDDATMPFNQEEIAASMDDKHLMGETPIPEALKEVPSFAFLQKKPLEAALQAT